MADFLSCLSRATKQRVLLGWLMGALAVQGCSDDDDGVEPGTDAGLEEDGDPVGGDGADGEDAGSMPAEDAGSEPDAGDGDSLDAGTDGDAGESIDAGADGDAGLADAGEPDAAVALVNGLRGDYYRGASFFGYAASRIDATVNFEYAADQSPITLPEDQVEFPATFYSVRWLGYIEPAVTATYKFIVSADDGQRLWIDGVKVLDGWQQGGASAEESTTVELQAGVRYPIRLDTFQHYNLAIAKLEWESTDGTVARQIVPTERLFALPLDQRPPAFVTFEAESPSNTATGPSAVDPVNNPIPKEVSCDNCSGLVRSPLGRAPNLGSITFNVNVGETGNYLLEIWYVNKGLQGETPYVQPSLGALSVNGGAEQELVFLNNYNDTSVFDWLEFEVPLQLGENTIKVSGVSNGRSDTNLDRITLRPVD